MINLSPVLQRTLLYTLGLLIMKSVSLIMVPIITKHLPLAEYGRLEILVTMANLGTIILGFGLTEALFRFSGKTQDDTEKNRIAANALALALLIGLLANLVLQLAAPGISSLLPGSASVEQVRWILISMSLEGCIAIPLARLRMDDRVYLFLWFSCGKALLQATMTYTALSLGFGVTGILIAGAVSALMLAIGLVWVQWQTSGIRLDASWTKAFFIYGGPLAVGGMATFAMGGLDRWMVADAVGVADLAPYAIATKFATITGLVLQPFGMWWFPRRFNLLETANRRKENARLAAMGAGFGFMAAAGIGLIAPVAIVFLTPEGYHKAVDYVPWLVLIVAIRHSSEYLNIGCYLQRTGILPMVINMTGSVLALLGYFIAIPMFGIAGAMMATGSAQLLRLILFFSISQRRMALPYTYMPLFLVMVISTSALFLGGWSGWKTEAMPIVLPSLLAVVIVAGFATGLLPNPKKLVQISAASAENHEHTKH